MCLTHSSQPMAVPGADDSYSPDATGPGGINPSVNPLAETLRNQGVDPGNFTVRKPSVGGRILEAATGGAYDPTGGVDTGQVGPAKTKFGALVSILRPALEGAAIGGFTGRWHPGGGFGGANEFYLNQRMRQMQAMQFMMNQAKMQSDIAKNQAETGWMFRRPGLTRTSNALKARDANGNEIYMVQNPNSGKYEPLNGVTPESSAKPMMTNKGLMSVNGPTATPITMADNAANEIASRTGASAGAPSKAAQADESGLIPPPEIGSPSQSPEGVRQTAPLMPPNSDKPKATRISNRNSAGVEKDSLIDENPESPTFGKTLKPNIATRAPLPDKTQNTENQKENTASKYESYAGAAMGLFKNDPDKAIKYLNGEIPNPNTGQTIDKHFQNPEDYKAFKGLLPQIRKSIRDRVKPGRSGRQHLTPEQAKAIGATPTQKSSVTDEDEDNEE